MPQKRVKKFKSNDIGVPDVSNSPFKDDLLMLLQVEILSRILIYTSSTKDILAVTRCSKYLCAILVDPSNASIWSRTRESNQFSDHIMPDPPNGMSEPAYAAFVFDGGKCAVCRMYTKAKYSSFAIKLRICKKVLVEPNLIEQKTCQNFFWEPPLFRPDLDADGGLNKEILRAIPVVEAEWCLAQARLRYSYNSCSCHSSWPTYPPYCRQEHWEQAKEKWTRLFEVEGEERYRTKLDGAIKKNKEWMEFCLALLLWKRENLTERATSKSTNLQMSKMIANDNGYDIRDLLGRTSYGPMYRSSIMHSEFLEINDFEQIAPTVERELLLLTERRKRGRSNLLQELNLTSLLLQYQRFRSQEPAMVLPSFSVFLRLPAIQSLSSFDGRKDDNHTHRREARVTRAKNLLELLKKPEIQIVIKSELSKWEANARKMFIDMLGLPPWISSNATVLHPLDRLTARFKCKDCLAVSNRYKMDGCLDFVGVCRHECGTSGANDEKSESWDASRFEKDQRASDAMKKLLTLLNVDEASVESLKLFRKRRPDLAKRRPTMVECMSCQPNLVLTDDNVIGHCHRHGHDNMEMRLFPSGQPATEARMRLSDTLVPGLVKELIDGSKESQGEKKYGCRLCLYAMTQQFKRYLPGRVARMTFNGFRSHLKARHGIETPGDEDIFRFE